jgi:hypothetical protein
MIEIKAPAKFLKAKHDLEGTKLDRCQHCFGGGRYSLNSLKLEGFSEHGVSVPTCWLRRTSECLILLDLIWFKHDAKKRSTDSRVSNLPGLRYRKNFLRRDVNGPPGSILNAPDDPEGLNHEVLSTGLNPGNQLYDKTSIRMWKYGCG